MRPRAAAFAILLTLLACARGLPPLDTPPASEVVVPPSREAPEPARPIRWSVDKGVTQAHRWIERLLDEEAGPAAGDS